MTASRKQLLESLLRILVEEWGTTRVQIELGRITANYNYTEPAKPAKKKSKTRFLAVEQIERSEILDAQKNSLRELAARFDRKQFLPSISDVREFLLMIGERPGNLKDRSEAFRHLLRALKKYPPERLAELVNKARHSRPSQLGPLSDAISAAADSLPRFRLPNES